MAKIERKNVETVRVTPMLQELATKEELRIEVDKDIDYYNVIGDALEPLNARQIISKNVLKERIDRLIETRKEHDDKFLESVEYAMIMQNKTDEEIDKRLAELETRNVANKELFLLKKYNVVSEEIYSERLAKARQRVIERRGETYDATSDERIISSASHTNESVLEERA